MIYCNIGAYKIMKGQIKTTMLMSKPYILQSVANGATFPIKHDAIRSMKLQIKGNYRVNYWQILRALPNPTNFIHDDDFIFIFKGAINGERAIVETDDDDDYSIRRLVDETKAKIARKIVAAQAAEGSTTKQV